MEKDLYESAKPVKIDVSYMGFSVTSNLNIGGGDGGCSSGSCSSGSCSTGGSSGGCSC